MALPHIWRDGEGGIFYLTGLSHTHSCTMKECDQTAAHAAAYLHPTTFGRRPEFAHLRKSVLLDAVRQRDSRRLNMSALLPMAAARLRSAAWLGCLNYRTEESMDQLSSMLGVGKDITLPHVRRHEKNVKHAANSGAAKEKISDATRARLARMVPYDMALFNFAKHLIDFKLGCSSNPSLPRPQLPAAAPATLSSCRRHSRPRMRRRSG